jgi:serine/threonine protein kinase
MLPGGAMINAVKVVGRYELLDPIGYGGMAVVYLACHTDLDRQVVPSEAARADRAAGTLHRL